MKQIRIFNVSDNLNKFIMFILILIVFLFGQVSCTSSINNNSSDEIVQCYDPGQVIKKG